MAVQETDGKQTAMRIDMNSDMGESFGRWTLGDDEALLDVVSSANVACGFHAGDPSVMLRTLSYAASRVAIDGTVVPLNADSVCVHGDSPSAVAMARAVRARLESEGVAIRAFAGDAAASAARD